jgi:SAM-dependent methyltransferase
MTFMPWLRYVSCACLFKAASATPAGRRFYRFLGNKYGHKRHAKISDVEIERGLWLLKVAEETGLASKQEARVLELGTGWTHFYSLFLRLFYDWRLTLFDVQDNRSLEAIKARFATLAEALPKVLPVAYQDNREIIQGRLQKIINASSFQGLYDGLGMRYVIDPQGLLDEFQENTFDLVFSMDVLEHVTRDLVPYEIASIYRILKPAGISAHQIGIDDHLSHYAPGMPSKNYLRYADEVWKIFFESKLQYFNRVQLSEFKSLFNQKHFKIILCDDKKDELLLSQLIIDKHYQCFDDDTLKTVRGYIVHYKIN